jgi:hypothetical protein
MITIRRIGVLSLAKVLGLLYALLGLIIGGLVTCFSLFGTLVAGANMPEGPEGPLFGLVFGLGSIIILPIFYGLAGFIGGLIVATLYNLLAGWVGGIELETT